MRSEIKDYLDYCYRCVREPYYPGSVVAPILIDLSERMSKLEGSEEVTNVRLSCATCKFWENKGGTDVKVCKRYPPRNNPDEWTRTDQWDWCGEHDPK